MNEREMLLLPDTSSLQAQVEELQAQVAQLKKDSPTARMLSRFTEYRDVLEKMTHLLELFSTAIQWPKVTSKEIEGYVGIASGLGKRGTKMVKFLTNLTYGVRDIEKFNDIANKIGE